MRRRLVRLAAMSTLALALGAAPAMAAGSPLTHLTYSATLLTSGGPVCGYTFTDGTVTEVFRTGDYEASHATFHNVVAERDGAAYAVLGTEYYNDPKGQLTIKLSFVAQGGGIADNINVVFRAGQSWDPADPFGSALVAHENDSCHLYS